MMQNQSYIVIEERIEAFWKEQYGEVVPLSNEEKVCWYNNIMSRDIASTSPPYPYLEPIPYVMFLMSYFPRAELPKPVPTSPLPIIEVPKSVLCFFNKWCGKYKPMVRGIGRNGMEAEGSRKLFGYTPIWNNFTLLQKTIWTETFLIRKRHSEMLVRNGLCTKALGREELRKQLRLQHLKK